MSTVPAVPPATKRRLPKWLKVTLSAFGVLFVLALIFGKSPTPSQPAPVAAPATTTTPTTSSAAPTTVQATTYEVTEVIHGATVRLSSPGGVTTARILGIEMPPPTGVSCFRAEAFAWASATLAGKQVVATLSASGTTVLSLTMADGTDFATAALQTGHAKYLADAAAGVAAGSLRAAESAARTAASGLWAPPCSGTITQEPVPTKVVTPPPAADPPPAAKPTPPKRTTEPASGGSAYYANCDAVRAAGAAPLRAGQPGYSRKLDRDGDGVACE